jgi:type II secretory pathway predicted ATPase ExeA
VDEAQNLARDAVEELRMLSNFQIEDHALLQSFLVGQPELWDLLQRDDLRQLRQRIPGVCQMKLLSRDEVYRYIRYRLAVAGLTNGQIVFSESAIDTIFEVTVGIPRLINMLCDRILLRGYLQKSRAVESDLVAASAHELGMVTPPRVGHRPASDGGGLN